MRKTLIVYFPAYTPWPGTQARICAGVGGMLYVPIKKSALTQYGSMRLEVARKGRFYTLGVIRYPEFHPSKTPKPPEERFLSLQDRPCAVPGPGNPAGSGFRADGGRL